MRKSALVSLPILIFILLVASLWYKLKYSNDELGQNFVSYQSGKLASKDLDFTIKPYQNFSSATNPQPAANIKTSNPSQISNIQSAKSSNNYIDIDPNASHQQLSELLGHYIVLNFFASWCTACRAEMHQLQILKQRDDLLIVGVNYKDSTINQQRFLHQFGQPFDFLTNDPNGSIAIKWQITGMPESFIIDKQGFIRYHFLGAVTAVQILNILEELDRTKF